MVSSVSEILMSLEDRIIQHLKGFTNPLGFEKLLTSLNINSDYSKIKRGELLSKLQEMKAGGKVRHSWGPQGWIDVRGRNGRHGSGKGMKGVHETWNSRGRRNES